MEFGRLALTPFQIPGVISIGPEVSFSAGLKASFNASAGVLAGITVNWDDVSVVVDLVNKGGSSATGFAPNQVKPNFILTGEITLTGNAYVVFGLDFGVEYVL